MVRKNFFSKCGGDVLTLPYGFEKKNLSWENLFKQEKRNYSTDPSLKLPTAHHYVGKRKGFLKTQSHINITCRSFYHKSNLHKIHKS